MKERKGEITVYLSLVFILLISLVGAMLESASIQNAKNNRRTDVNRAMESVFAEYQKELLEQYDLFALDGSYETGQYAEGNLCSRLAFYGAGNMEHEVGRIQFLTDHGCQAFYEQVSAYMKHRYGLTAAEDLLGSTALWKEQQETAMEYDREEMQKQEEIHGLLEENETVLPKEKNPLDHMESLKACPLLELVCPRDMQPSAKSIQAEELLSHRERNCGYGDFSDVADPGGTISKLLLGEYLLEHFHAAAEGPGDGPLDYELEYILCGRSSDRENLEKTAEKLMLLRFVPNYGYIQTDGEMRAEAETLAATLCTLAALPAVTEAVAQGILLAWALGETIIDLRALLKGSKVPAVKSKASWQLQLSALLTLGTGEDYTEGMDDEKGLDYKEYLRILLFLEGAEQIGIRSLDMIEQILQKKEGLAFFKADQCVSRMEVASTCRLRRGITYQFQTYFGYH